MANTGIEIVLTLAEAEAPCPPPYSGCTLTGNTKTNDPEDPDYIAPFENLTNCPVSFTTTCPPIIATGHTLEVEYEFALLSSVLNNPALDKVKVKAMLMGVEEGSVTTVLSTNPTLNYFTGTITGLAAATIYDIQIDYLDSLDAVVAACPVSTTATTSA